MRPTIRAVAVSAALSVFAIAGAATVVGAAGTDGRHACDAANTMAAVIQMPDGHYLTDVSRADWSDPNQPTFVESTAVSITAKAVKDGVKVTWAAADSAVRQLGGVVQTSTTSGYTGKFFNAKIRKYTVTLNKGSQLDFLTACFNDTHYPAGTTMPGSVSPAARGLR
ncbi:MAG: hypothetical protein LC792_00745 [Actinobacteria bacterium]|nr:hypothetical protein [Actinomycetota bacterium]